MVSGDATADPAAPPGDERPGSHRSRPLATAWLALFGLICGGLGAGLTSHDWCATTLSAALLTGVIVAACDALALRPLAQRGRLMKAGRLLAPLILACVIAASLHLGDDEAFERAFGSPPPVGVRELHIDYSLTFVDTVTLMRFRADQAAIDRVLAGRPFVSESDMVQLFVGEVNDIDKLWRYAFTGFGDLGSEPWQDHPPMSRPALYRWSNEDALEQTVLLWDAQSGRAYVLYTFG